MILHMALPTVRGLLFTAGTLEQQLANVLSQNQPPVPPLAQENQPEGTEGESAEVSPAPHPPLLPSLTDDWNGGASEMGGICSHPLHALPTLLERFRDSKDKTSSAAILDFIWP